MATCTSTSPGLGGGTGRSITRMSRGPKSTADRIVSGIVNCSTTAGSVNAMASSALGSVGSIKAGSVVYSRIIWYTLCSTQASVPRYGKQRCGSLQNLYTFQANLNIFL